MPLRRIVLLRRTGRLIAATVVLLTAGCRFGGPPPAPPENFGDFSVGLFGGVAGLQSVLRVRTDGVAVLASSNPRSGRIGAADLERLRTLLTSEDFRREVAAGAETPPGSDRCSDLFTREVTMGALTLRKTDRCGDEPRPTTPVFDEILDLLHEEMDGSFAAPVGSAGPPPVPVLLVREARTGDPGYTITTDEAGRVTRRGGAAGDERRTLADPDQQTLGLLLDVVREAPPRSCTGTGTHTLTIRTVPPVTGTNCRFQARSPQFWAIVLLLESQFA